MVSVAYVLIQGEGGLPHYTAELANAVAEYADVSVLKPKTTTADEFFAEGVTVAEPFESMELSLPKIARGDVSPTQVVAGLRSFGNIDYLTTLDPDVVHFTAPMDLFPPVKLAVRYRGIDITYPLVETFHDIHPRWFVRRGRDLDPSEPVGSLLIYNLKGVLNGLLPSPRQSHVIVHTRQQRERLVANRLPADRVSRIPHGVYNLFRDIGTCSPTEEHTVLFFGNLVASKGVDTLIRALPVLCDAVPDVNVIIAGDGSLSDESRALIKRFADHVELRTEFIPNDEVGALFSRAAVVAIPHRRQEGHSGTLTIAYSFETPVVTTSVGEFPDLVRDTGCGLIVPPNDPEALGQALATVLNNDGLQETMSQNAGTMRHRLSWDAIAKKHLQLYQSLG